MKVLGYDIGELKVEAAMTSDIIMRHGTPTQMIANEIEMGRRVMAVRPGMNRKYTPFRYDHATGGPVAGGRYIFDTWENATNYFDWLEKLEMEPGVKFWSSPAFVKVDRFVWKVIGAHDFTPVETHGINRFERWQYNADAKSVDRVLTELWPTLRERARKQGLGGVWLMNQPDKRLLAIVSAGNVTSDDRDPDTLRNTIERLECMDSLGHLFPEALALTKSFDRTNMVISTWLPISGQHQGSPVANPVSPPLPAPQVPPEAA